MAARPIIKFYLLHDETGQRYAVSDQEIVIGRTSGDILFPDDVSLAPAQCRIIPLDQGLSVHDLTAPTPVARLVDGDRLHVGAQTFTLIEVTRAKPRPPRARKSTARPSDSRLGQLGLVIMVACGVGLLAFALRGRAPGGVPAPTSAQIDREIEESLRTYRQIANVPEEEIPKRLRKDLIPGLERTQLRLRDLTLPNDARQRLVATLLRQTRAMASYYETGDPDVERVLDEATRELASVRGQVSVGTRRADRTVNELPTASPPGK